MCHNHIFLNKLFHRWKLSIISRSWIWVSTSEANLSCFVIGNSSSCCNREDSSAFDFKLKFWDGTECHNSFSLFLSVFPFQRRKQHSPYNILLHKLLGNLLVPKGSADCIHRMATQESEFTDCGARLVLEGLAFCFRSLRRQFAKPVGAQTLKFWE